ncbi:MAG: hypothetical protein AAGK37_12525 [Pseudomonadota bacterium]
MTEKTASPTGEGRLAAEIAESLMPGSPDTLRQLFNKHGARAPTILWSPGVQELRSALLRRFADRCAGWMDDAGRVSADAFDLTELDALKDWLMVIEPAGDEGYRYLSYGGAIAEHFGQDMTGRTTRSFGGHITVFFEGLYEAARRRKEWALSEHEPPKAIFVRTWRRLIVPLFAPDGDTVTRFAVLNVPENELRAGLELMPDPIFVLGADEDTYFANQAAQRMFDLGQRPYRGLSLRQLTGISLENQPSPVDLLVNQTVNDSLQLTLKGGMAERLIMTVSAAEHRGRALYIVVMRLIPT